MKVRFGHFNIRDLSMEKLADPDNIQARMAASIVKRFRPDVLSVNEIEASPEAPGFFVEKFLNRGDDPIDYPHHYLCRTNSGIPSGGPAPFDYRGFGLFPGQYGLALLSRFRILPGTREFFDFPWRALPQTVLGCDNTEVPPDYPLFSTGCADIPVDIEGKGVHVILTHLSIPIRGYLSRERNADQSVFLRQYIDGKPLPGLGPLESDRFVLMGDLNSDPEAGDGIKEPIKELLEDGRITFRRAEEATFLEGGGLPGPLLAPEGFQLRLDYVLPSRALNSEGMRVFRPEGERDWWKRARIASDHFFLWCDCDI